MSIIYKTFKTPKNYYVYDRNTNSVLLINEEVYDALNHMENDQDTTENMSKIIKYQDRGYLKENVVVEIKHPSTDLLEHYITHRMTQITLQVTQNCNLRCGYCVYSGDHQNRSHSNKVMTFETAKKAIDLIASQSLELDEISVAFYGGEPLLEFELIKKCVDYIEETLEGKSIVYAITTNGTLLTPKLADYFAEHNINITISLDGSKNEHDVNRRFANGKGSFDVIMSNIEKIKRHNPEFIKKIAINTVINPKSDYSCVKEFFETDEIIKDASVGLNLVDSGTGKNNYNEYADDFWIVRRYEYFKFLLGLTKRIDKKYSTKLLRTQKNMIDHLYSTLQQRQTISTIQHHGGPCIPGARRLFVTVDGDLFPCERVSEISETVHLGSLSTGIDVKKAEEILNVGKVTEQECLNCWALLHCSMCVAQCDDGEKICKCTKLKNCEQSKRKVLDDLLEVSALKEFGYDFKEASLG